MTGGLISSASVSSDKPESRRPGFEWQNPVTQTSRVARVGSGGESVYSVCSDDKGSLACAGSDRDVGSLKVSLILMLS